MLKTHSRGGIVNLKLGKEAT